MIELPGRGDPGEYEHYGAFGYCGDEVGRHAIYALAEFSRPLSGSELELTDPIVWSPTDRDASEAIHMVDWGFDFIEPHRDTNATEIEALHKNREELHLALPLTEGERKWLETERHFVIAPEDDELVALWLKGETIHATPADENIRGKVSRIREAGVLRTVEGDDLIRRWWAWRRAADEFADQGSLDVASEALGKISLMLVTEANWPLGHRDILDRLRGDD